MEERLIEAMEVSGVPNLVQHEFCPGVTVIPAPVGGAYSGGLLAGFEKADGIKHLEFNRGDSVEAIAERIRNEVGETWTELKK